MSRDFAEKELMPVAAHLDQNSMYGLMILNRIIKQHNLHINNLKFSRETN